MKLPATKLLVKFLVGMSLYAGAIWAACLFDDYRKGFFIVVCLCALTFGMALWAILRDKRTVAVILAASMALMPVRAADNPPPEKDAVVAIIAGCGILIVGGIIVYGVWKLCKKLPSPPKKGGPNSPATNPEPEFVIGPVIPGSPAPPLIMPDTDLSNTGVDYEILSLDFQSSTNGNDWRTEYTATNWAGPDRVFCVLYSNSIPLMTNQHAARWTNETFIMDFSTVMPTKETAPLKTWRAVQVN